MDLIASLDDDIPIVATPGWSARDLLGHVVGVAADVVAGNVDRYAQDDWTRAQVERRAAASRTAVLAEWEELLPSMCLMLDDPTSHGLDESFRELPVIDLLAHEHDLREAAGVTRFANETVWQTVAPRRRAVLELQHTMAALPALDVCTPQGDRWRLGAGDAVTVVVDRYELWRSLEGRRPRSAARTFEWSANPEPFLDHWTGFVFDWAREPRS